LSAIKNAVAKVGGQSELARVLGIRPQSVQSWVKAGEVPLRRVVEVEAATGGAVTRYELRPDFFGLERPAALR